MSNPINNGGPAFPYAFEHDDPPQSGFAPGMTLRDWFAGQALQGLLTGDKPSASAPCHLVASWAYEQSDAMLAERAKGGAS